MYGNYMHAKANHAHKYLPGIAMVDCLSFLLSQDIEMHRGKPLYLNEERYAALNHMVRSLSFFILLFVSYSIFSFGH